MVIDTRPIWWRAFDGPPPTLWVVMFDELTGDESVDQWGLAAGIFIAQTRHRTKLGPTFSEMFAHLLPDTSGLPGPLSEKWEKAARRRLVGDFRLHVAIAWRQRDWISWNPGVERSLRTGRAFRARSRHYRQKRAAGAAKERQFGTRNRQLEDGVDTESVGTLFGEEAAGYGRRLVREARGAADLTIEGECQVTLGVSIL